MTFDAKLKFVQTSLLEIAYEDEGPRDGPSNICVQWTRRQWFRYVTGTLEVAGAILLLIPRTSGLGALMLAGVMVGALVTHVFIVGGSPLMAIILLVVTGVVAWGRRQRTMNLLAGLRSR